MAGYEQHLRGGPQATAERAFVALRYALGHRGSKLLLGLVNPGSCARELAKALGRADRMERAHVLAADLTPVIEALEKMRISCR